MIGPSVDQLELLKNQAFFISGASGFVGKWLVEVVNYLNENHGFNMALHCQSRTMVESAKKLPSLFEKKWISLKSGDIKDLNEIPSDVSYVIHLAGTPDNRNHASDPIRVMDDLFSGTNKILDAATRLDSIKNFVHFSSGHVYGPQPFANDCLDENSFQGFNSASLTSAYAEGKRVSESLVQAYRSQCRMAVTILRPFAFIGPYQSIERPWAINNFIRDGLYSKPIRILGDEDTTRSYMYPSEMALWTLRASLQSTNGACFNLGSSDGMTLRSVAQTVDKSFNGVSGVTSNIPLNNNLKSKFVPSVQKFEKTFETKLKILSNEAIRKAIEWYRLGDY